jgi:peptide/nickel transport system substrate-binding protein
MYQKKTRPAEVRHPCEVTRCFMQGVSFFSARKDGGDGVMKKSTFLVLTALALGLACNPAMAAKDRLIIADQYDVTSMDPIGHNDVPSSRCCYELYDTLIFRDNKGNILPGLAESWEFPSPTEYVFHIRKGVKFHNGEELKAEDVAFTIMRATTDKGAKIRSYSQDVKSAKAIDDYTCVIELKAPNFAFFNSLTHCWGSILNKKAVEAAGDNYGTLANPPVGTGPFKFLSWSKNDKYVLERFEDFWGKKPAYKYLEVRSIPEASNRTIELETGGVDIAYPIVVNDLNRVKDNPDLVLHQTAATNVNYLGFNTQKAPFSNVAARRAVSAALDTTLIHKAVFERLGKNGSVPRAIVPAQFKYSIAAECPEHKQDVELAKKLFAEAGMGQGTTVQLWTNERKERMDMAQIIKAQLAEFGINAEIKVLEWGAYLNGLQEKQHDMFILGWSTGVPDANFAMSGLLESDAGSNYTFFNNKEFDEAMDKGRATEDGPDRAAAYRTAQEIINDQVPMIFLHSDDNCVGTQKFVKGFEVGSNDTYNFREVYFEGK